MSISSFNYSKGQILDLLYKKVSFTISKTDTEIAKSPANETDPSHFAVNSEYIPMEDIPSTPPATTTADIEVVTQLTMTEDQTSEPRRSWKSSLTKWISPAYGSLYLVTIEAGGVNLNINGSGNDDQWYFDYSSGVLHFIGENLPSEVLTNPVVISGYRFIGTTLKDYEIDLKTLTDGSDALGLHTHSDYDAIINNLPISSVWTDEPATTLLSDVKMYVFSKFKPNGDASWTVDISALNLTTIYGVFAQALPPTGSNTGGLLNSPIATVNSVTTSSITGQVVENHTSILNLFNLLPVNGLRILNNSAMISVFVLGKS